MTRLGGRWVGPPRSSMELLTRIVDISSSISLKACGMAFRLWVRGDEVRPAIHPTDWDRYTLAIPPGAHNWQRIATTFRTGNAQTALNIGINIVNRCKAFCVDDVVLRPLGQRIATGGVEWLPTTAQYGRTIMNLINLLGGPIDVEIRRDNRPVAARDLLIRVGDR